MSEASRARRQRAINIREEFAARGINLDDPTPLEGAADLDPSWGPVGSLAKQLLTPEEYTHLMQLHEDMLALARSRNPPQLEPEEHRGSDW